MKKFSATERLVQSDSSWCTMRMPRRCASPVSYRANGNGSPSKAMPPRVGGTAPLRMRISVDLPAPLRPTRPITSPGIATRSIPALASVGP